MHVWSGDAGEVAQGVVADVDGRVTEAWTGPQVAWQMARGRPGAFGGKLLTSWPVWLALSAVFLVGLADLRRPFSLHTLDLLVLLSFGVSLAFFNRGEVFRSASLAVIPLVYLLARTAWIGFRRQARPRPGLPGWPVWLLAAATLFLVGFRVGLNVEQPRTVIDVGYAGVIGADRILDGRAPYGRCRWTAGGRAGRPAPTADPRANPGRRPLRVDESARRYVRPGCVPRLRSGGPGARLGRSVGRPPGSARDGDRRGPPRARRARARRAPARRRPARGSPRLRLGRVSVHGVRPDVEHERRDHAGLLVWGFWLASSPAARGAAVALAGWTKFAALLVTPLWLTYRSGLRPSSVARFAAAFAAATVAVFSVLLLEPSLFDALRTFWDRTIGFQLGRESPFSIWGWGQYHAGGIPDLGSLQTVVQVGAIVLAGVAAALPREKGPLELAALTAAILLAVELSLTHWFYLYLPWVLPFVLLALCAPRTRAPDAA